MYPNTKTDKELESMDRDELIEYIRELEDDREDFWMESMWRNEVPEK